MITRDLDSFNIRKALIENRGNLTAASYSLKIRETSLEELIETYGLDIASYRRIDSSPKVDRKQPDPSRFYGLSTDSREKLDSYKGLGWALEFRKTMLYMKKDIARVIVDIASSPYLIMLIRGTPSSEENLYTVPPRVLFTVLDGIVK